MDTDGEIGRAFPPIRPDVEIVESANGRQRIERRCVIPPREVFYEVSY